MCVGVQLTIKIREYEYCRLDLAVEQQVGEWGNAQEETAFAAKLRRQPEPPQSLSKHFPSGPGLVGDLTL